MAYRWVGWCPVDVAALLSPVDALVGAGKSGYTRTDPRGTMAAYAPLVGDLFPGAWHAAYIVALWPGAQIPLHVDDGTAVCVGIRYYLVLATNPECWCFHAGVWQHLQQDGVYSADPAWPHGAVNWGERPRVHLMVETSNGIKI